MSFHATETFSFGDVSLSCVSSPDSNQFLNVNRVDCPHVLPEGKAVDSIEVYVVDMMSPDAIHDFSFDLVLHGCGSKGNPETGEHLDAQSWQLEHGILMIGTEDSDALRARMAWIQANENPIEFLPNGFRLSFAYVPPNASIEFHFVLAYNQVECEHDSEWFAVDIPHSKLRNSAVLERIAVANARRN